LLLHSILYREVKVLNLDRFRREFSQLVLKGKELGKLTSIFGTNSPLIQHTINLAVSCIEEGEAYFEVGCLFGSSLESACAGNEHVEKYAWDIQLQGQVGNLVNNPNNKIKFHEGDYFEEYPRFTLDSFLKHPISVYYYDAHHGAAQTLVALEKIIPYLAHKALILADDIEYGSVYNSWRRFAREHSNNFTIIHEFWTPDKFIACTKGFKENYWDGFALMEYQAVFEEEDESIVNKSVEIWHGMGEYKDRHGTLHPKEFKHIHGQEEHKWE
jgi:hypothetical protein